MIVKDFLCGLQTMNTTVSIIGIFDTQKRELYKGIPADIPSDLRKMEVLHIRFTPEINCSVVVPTIIREVQELDIVPFTE